MKAGVSTCAIRFKSYTPGSLSTAKEHQMSDWRISRTTETYKEYMNISTSEIKTVRLATDKQFRLVQNLRAQVGKEPLKQRPAVYAATKAIDKPLEKTSR